MLRCEHNSTCSDVGGAHCVCADGYYGHHCNLSVDPCDDITCYHGGQCQVIDHNATCICSPPWRGTYEGHSDEYSIQYFKFVIKLRLEFKFAHAAKLEICSLSGRQCQTFFSPNCQLMPCLNNGTCIPDNTTADGYTCECIRDDMGPNCEWLPCESDPCMNNGTCTSHGDTYTCSCASGFYGDNCEEISITVHHEDYLSLATSSTPVLLTTAFTTPTDRCQGVQCLNQGSCHNHGGNFKCECALDFKGQYCQTKRMTSMHVYDVQFTLVRRYSSGLHLNETFKQELSNALHALYRPHLHDSKLRLEIVRFRPGCVIVELAMMHTVYTDSVTIGTEAMKAVLHEALMTGKLGHMTVNLEHFRFELKPGKLLQKWYICRDLSAYAQITQALVV